MWGTGSHGAAKSTPEFAQGRLRDFLGLPPLAIVMSLHCFFLDICERDSHFPTCFFCAVSLPVLPRNNTLVTSSEVLLLPVVVERALAGAGVAVLPSRLAVNGACGAMDQTWA